jgi:hypothetical protein
MGTLLRIDAPRLSGNRAEGTDRREPMEPPVGYGSTHRSIFRSPNLERIPGEIQGRSGKPKTRVISVLIVEQAHYTVARLVWFLRSASGLG